MNEIKRLTEAFIQRLTRAVSAETRDKLLVALGGSTTRFIAPDLSKMRIAIPAAKNRRKSPIQLCPVLRCPNRAAPALGMVCSKHRDVPKAKIRVYRAARRLAKKVR